VYGTVRVYRAAPELADVLASREAEVRAVVSGIPGFRAYYLLKTEDGAVGIGVYDSEEAAEASTQATSAWLRENLPVRAFSPDVSAGHVVIDGSDWV
jgi:heme-degrading monooxygenase HmoA